MKKMSPAEAREFLLTGTRNGVPGELLIRVTITKIVAQKELAA
jgi:hypothetical protein